MTKITNGDADLKTRKKPGMVIREMEIDDLPDVFHLGEQLFKAELFPNLYHTWDEHEIVQLFDTDQEFCLVAECQGQLAGFALGTTVEKSRSAWKYGLLIWLGVAPEWQQSGVGLKLYNQFQELMIEEGVRMLIVDTEADNLPALRFFRKLGFGKPQEHIYLSLNLDGLKKNHHDK